MKGFYLLLIKLDKDKNIEIGKLGTINFNKGFYIYVGSALGGENRPFRHFRKKKKRHWHIDFLLDQAEIIGMIFMKGDRGDEVKIAERLSKIFSGIKGFGASDSPLETHLFYTEKRPMVLLNKIFLW